MASRWTALVLVLTAAFVVLPAAQANHSGNLRGSIHWHADFTVYVNGEPVDFSKNRYMVQAQFVHVEGGDGETVHVHQRGATFGEFLDTLGWSLSSSCLEDGQGRTFCEGDDADLILQVNGQAVDDLAGYEFRNGDTITVAYRGPTVQESPWQNPAMIAGAILLILGGAYAAWKAREHRRLQQASRSRRRRAEKNRDVGLDTPVHALPSVRKGGAFALVGVLALAGAFTVLGDTVLPATPPTVEEGGFAAIHYLAYDQDGTVRASSLGGEPSRLDPTSSLSNASAAPVRTYAAKEAPQILPSGWGRDSLDPVVPGVRDALAGHREGDVFEVGPLSPEEAYGRRDPALLETKNRTLVLDRDQSVTTPSPAPSEGDRVNVTVGTGIPLPATVVSVDGDRTHLQLDPDNGTVRGELWNATVTVHGDRVEVVQHPVEGRTYTVSGSTFTVRNVTDATYVEDYNHRLAGRTLTFKVRVAFIPPPRGDATRDEAPQISLQRTVDGGAFSLAEETEQNGKIVVMSSMGAWCSTCKLEAREMKTAYQQYQGSGNVLFVGVDITPNRDTMQSLAQFQSRYGHPDFVYVMDDGSFLRKYEISVMDQTVIVTPNGKIAYTDRGITSAATFTREIDNLRTEFGMEGA